MDDQTTSRFGFESKQLLSIKNNRFWTAQKKIAVKGCVDASILVIIPDRRWKSPSFFCLVSCDGVVTLVISHRQSSNAVAVAVVVMTSRLTV